MDINWMISYVNKSYPSCMLFKFLKGNYLKTVTDRQNLTTRHRKGLKERIPNDILHVTFKRKISVSQSNLMYPKYGLNVYKYLKRQKRPKRVKMLISKWYRKQEYFFIHPFRSFQCIGFVKKHFFLSRIMGRVVGDFRLCLLSGAPGHLDWTKLA